MVADAESTDDYARQPVPDAATIHGFGIAIVITGMGATLPLFALGSQVSIALGLRSASGVFFFGCTLAGILSALTSVVGARARLSTYMIMTFAFGRRGGQVVNALLGVMLIGWFATTGELLGAVVHDALASIYGINVPAVVYTVLSLCAMTVTAIFGFKLMERFALITVPLLLVLMTYVAFLSIARHGLASALAQRGDRSITEGAALSSVIGLCMLTAVLAPDLTRFARNDRHALVTVLGLVIGWPLALLAAGLPAIALGHVDLMKIMIALGIPGVAVSVLIMSTWTSNTSNLYCSTLTLATLFRRASVRKIGLIAAVIALGGAVFGLANHFIPLLIALGIISAPLAGVYLSDFFVVKRQRYDIEALASGPAVRLSAFVAWAAGSAVGFLSTTHHVSLTTIPAADSVFAASAAYLLLNVRFGRRVRMPATESGNGPCA
jgi:cytosine permease